MGLTQFYCYHADFGRFFGASPAARPASSTRMICLFMLRSSASAIAFRRSCRDFGKRTMIGTVLGCFSGISMIDAIISRQFTTTCNYLTIHATI